jgi:hypothetical protein
MATASPLTRHSWVGLPPLVISYGTQHVGRAFPRVRDGTSEHMPSDPDRSERWRALAAEALEIAQQLTEPAAMQIMLRIAEGYLDLARRAEERVKKKSGQGRN